MIVRNSVYIPTQHIPDCPILAIPVDRQLSPAFFANLLADPPADPAVDTEQTQTSSRGSSLQTQDREERINEVQNVAISEVDKGKGRALEWGIVLSVVYDVRIYPWSL